ncbi:MAG TPA: formyltetrahydrofolate deformylase [Solirubrobacteraceae bacterium]|nr:formyltetrahydrofolate deformylase [Solirubrobacteraceae bacterium]
MIGCPDRPGIVAAVSGFLFEQGANIVSSHQYSSDPSGGRFFLRTEFFLDGLSDVGDAGDVETAGDVGKTRDVANARGAAARERLAQRFAAAVGERFQMDWKIRYWGERQRVAILVSRQDHCLVDLLWRWRRRELAADIVAVISNHRELEPEALAAGVPYHHVPTAPERREAAEAQLLELLDGQAELLVLARYMQILSGDFLARVGMPVINIHHSFLPAFAGADPYRRAREQGVKLIGATAHYVTEELDAGPIIEQDVVRVDHRQSVEDLQRVGRDIERTVLARAVSLHLEDRVIADRGRTIVF